MQFDGDIQYCCHDRGIWAIGAGALLWDSFFIEKIDEVIET